MGIKYRFIYQSIHGVQYTVNIIQSGYSGSVTSRNLGKAPVLHMKDGNPFRATSCDLTLECRTDGEYAGFYTSNPLEYEVQIFRDNAHIWSGFLATEIYSEPNIAPPYDVSVTATDGLGTLKEYIFEPVGLQPLRAHMIDLLHKTGLDMAIDWAMTLSQAGGTVPDFVDEVSINLDYLAGENCYTVLETLLVSLHATITQYDGRWLVIRETDISLGTSNIPVYRTPSRSGSTSVTSISGGRKSAGKMGVADMWPVGYTTRKAVPAKRRITVESPWHVVNAAPSVQGDEWDNSGLGYNYYTGASFVNVGDGNSYYEFGSSGGYNFTDVIFAEIFTANFIKTVDVKIRASIAPGQSTGGALGMYAEFFPTGGSSFIAYAGPEYGWGSYATSDSSIPKHTVDLQSERATDAQEFSISLPPPSGYGYSSGTMKIFIVGKGIRVFDVSITPNMNKGYRDEIIIGNGARGDGDSVSITGGRMTQDDFDIPGCYQGVWMESDSSSAIPVYLFTDSNFGSKDFMSIQALGRALSVAAHRVETYGTLDFPANMSLPPIAIQSNGSNALVTSYDWDMYNEEFRFNAVTLPSASLSVTSETVTALGDADSGVNSGGSSGGGGGSSYTLPIASANSLGGIKVGSGLSIDSSTGVLSATGGSGGGGTVTSVGMTVPTGMTISGSPITASGTLALGLATGKTIPDSADVDKGVTAYGWGDHANAGYATTSDLGDYVTLATTQNNISGEKTFITNPVHIGSTSGLKVDGSSYIDIGDVRLAYDSTAECLHVTNRAGTNKTIGMYADGTVAAGGVGAQTSFLKYIQCTQSEYNAISPKDITTLYIINDGARVYLGSILLFSEA